MKHIYISHPQDLTDAFSSLKGLPLPYVLMAQKQTPEKYHEDEYEKKRKLMAYFHRTIVPAYAEQDGITEDQAKAQLQIKFARVGEITIDESGEYDVVWMENDKTRIFEQGKKYYVLSVAGMDNKTLRLFIDQCKRYLLTTYGLHLFEHEYVGETKTITLK